MTRIEKIHILARSGWNIESEYPMVISKKGYFIRGHEAITTLAEALKNWEGEEYKRDKHHIFLNLDPKIIDLI